MAGALPGAFRALTPPTCDDQGQPPSIVSNIAQVEADTPEIRDALCDHTSNAHTETRGEAMVGLARRKDARVLESLNRELASDYVGRLAV